MPKGVYPRKKRKNKREEILRAASSIYAQHGFEGSTIVRIAELAGVSKSLISRHFGTKREMVRAIADRAAEKTLESMRIIDASGDLTLREREYLIHDLVKRDLDEWRIILGIVLVPAFQFRQRGELVRFVQMNLQAVKSRRDELREPTDEMALAYAYSAVCLHVGYIVGGQEEIFLQSLAKNMDMYLLP